jgi:uncharacterized membrane protein YeaQ/YmgE (transglycosylase-associated protein family)
MNQQGSSSRESTSAVSDAFSAEDRGEYGRNQRWTLVKGRLGPEEGGVGIIAFLILGLLAGAIAKALLPGDDPGGIIVTMLIGVVGALLGGFLAAALFDADPLDEFFDISTWLTAIVGAIILLLIYRMATRRRV